jgi:hypothetical protein
MYSIIVDIYRIPRLGTVRLKNEICHVFLSVDRVDRKFCINEETVYFKGSKRRKLPAELQNEIWAPRSVWSCDICDIYQSIH